MILDGYLLFVICILGLVEGLTEFLPISSSLHMAFFGNLLGFGDEVKIKFLLGVILQFAAIFSLLIVFWKECFIVLSRRKYFKRFIFCSKSSLCCGHIFLGILPTIILGLVFYERIKNLFKVEYMLYSLILGGILLLFSELFMRRFVFRTGGVSNINKISYLQAFLVGCFQCLALCPGFSRSGATISGGLLLGMSRYVASIFSFILAVPIILGASVLVLYKNFYFFTYEDLPLFIVGFFSAFIISLFTVKIFIRIIQHVSFVPFAIYRFILAGLIYFFQFSA